MHDFFFIIHILETFHVGREAARLLNVPILGGKKDNENGHAQTQGKKKVVKFLVQP